MSVDRIDISLKGASGRFSLNVSFAAPASGITCIYGPSGSGKTTLLRAVAGLERLAGNIIVGQNVWQSEDKGIFLPPHDRQVGYVPQEASLFPHLSVLNNLQFGTQFTRHSNVKNETLLPTITAILGLSHLIERPTIHKLSGGEKQRVAIGRALMVQPRMLLMDEPVSGLDHSSRLSLLSSLNKLRRELDIPIFYVSHEFDEVLKLADHIVFLNGGQVEKHGPARQVFEEYNYSPSGITAEAYSFFPARVQRHDNAAQMTSVCIGNQEVFLPQTQARVGEELILKIHAHNVALATKKPEAISIRNILRGTISSLSKDISSGSVSVSIDVENTILKAAITLDAQNDLNLKIGQEVFALVKSVSVESLS